MANMLAEVTCLECGTELGEWTGKSTYKHMIGCLHVEPDAFERIRETAQREWGLRGQRVIHLLDAMERVEVVIDGGVC